MIQNGKSSKPLLGRDSGFLFNQMEFNFGGGWAPPPFTIDLDFANNRVVGATDFDSVLTTTRAGSAYAQNNDGSWTAFSANTLRRTNKGLLIESSNQNLFLNSLTPVTQTITVTNGATYAVTLFSEGGTLTLSNAATGTVLPNTPTTFVAASTSLTVTCNSITGAFQCVNVEATAPTSPIVTAGTAASRAADVVSFINGGDFVDINEGSAYAEWFEQRASFNAARRLWTIRESATEYTAALLTTTNNAMGLCVSAGSTQSNLTTTGASAINTISKFANRWKLNDFAIRGSSVFGAPPANDTSGTPPDGVFSLQVGHGGATFQLNSYLRRLIFFDSALTDNQLTDLVI